MMDAFDVLSIILDYREHKLISILETKPNVAVNNLDIGDIQFVNQQGEVITIIERKTLSDLSSSICDNRYKEQKMRLLASNKPIIYIIEGTSIMNPQQLGAIVNMTLRDKITVFRTMNINETAKLIENLQHKLIKFENYEYKEDSSSVISTIKKENVDAKTIYISQLCCFPGISKTIANNIYEVYPSMKEFIQNVNNIDKIPKIGKKIKQNIINFLDVSSV